MKITETTDYALRAMIELSDSEGGAFGDRAVETNQNLR